MNFKWRKGCFICLLIKSLSTNLGSSSSLESKGLLKLVTWAKQGDKIENERSINNFDNPKNHYTFFFQLSILSFTIVPTYENQRIIIIFYLLLLLFSSFFFFFSFFFSMVLTPNLFHFSPLSFPLEVAQMS